MAPSATAAGALKQYLESLNLDLDVYRDRAPNNAPLPYVRVVDGITTRLRGDGDFGDPDGERAVTEEVQLDLYQPHHDATNAVVEDYELADQLTGRLHGAALAPFFVKHVYGVRVLVSTRFAPDDNDNVVRHLITVALDRAL